MTERTVMGVIDALAAAASKTLYEYDLWAEDANDGEFAIWSRERFMASFLHLREALAKYEQTQPGAR